MLDIKIVQIGIRQAFKNHLPLPSVNSDEMLIQCYPILLDEIMLYAIQLYGMFWQYWMRFRTLIFHLVVVCAKKNYLIWIMDSCDRNQPGGCLKLPKNGHWKTKDLIGILFERHLQPKYVSFINTCVKILWQSKVMDHRIWKDNLVHLSPFSHLTLERLFFLLQTLWLALGLSGSLALAHSLAGGNLFDTSPF